MAELSDEELLARTFICRRFSDSDEDEIDPVVEEWLRTTIFPHIRRREAEHRSSTATAPVTEAGDAAETPDRPDQATADDARATVRTGEPEARRRRWILPRWTRR